MEQNKIVEILLKRGKGLFKKPYKHVEFTRDPEADILLNNLKEYPHAFVLACIMNRQIKAERAFSIPYKISIEIGTFKIEELLKINFRKYKKIFFEKNLHRFNDKMAKYFYEGLKLINKKYDNVASNIWNGNPKSATVVSRFLQFPGIGIKISTMATNILSRDFKISFQDYLCIDISPDVHVKRSFTRLGLIDKNASNDELIYCARELNPEYPGIFDLSAWEIGRTYCHPRNPECNNCYLEKYYPKNI